MSLLRETQPLQMKHRVVTGTYIFCLANVCIIYMALLFVSTSSNSADVYPLVTFILLSYLLISQVHTHYFLLQTADCQSFLATCLSAFFKALYSNSCLVPLGIAVERITHGSRPLRHFLVQVIPTKAGKDIQEQADDLCSWQAKAQEIL